MSEEIEFNKQVYNKSDYQKIIKTSFNQLGVESIQTQLTQQPNINDFFDLYNTLFYDIPETGIINSHEYIIKTSAEYIGFEDNIEEITALQNEIAQLRIELLESQKQVIELQTGTTLANPQ